MPKSHWYVIRASDGVAVFSCEREADSGAIAEAMGTGYQKAGTDGSALWLRWDSEIASARAEIAVSEQRLLSGGLDLNGDTHDPSGDEVDHTLADWHPKSADYLRCRRYLELLEKSRGLNVAASRTVGSAAISLNADRLAAIQSLLGPMVEIDDYWHTLKQGLRRLRVQRDTRDLPFDRVVEVQEQVRKLTQPFSDAISQAREASFGIGVALTGLLANPGQWEVQCRLAIRQLADLVAAVPNSTPSKVEDDCLSHAVFELWHLGQELQAAHEAAEAMVAADRKTIASKVELPNPSADTNDREYRPASWFPKGMAPRLRMAASKDRKTKRVASQVIDGVVRYSVSDARRWWPDDVPKCD